MRDKKKVRQKFSRQRKKVRDRRVANRRGASALATPGIREWLFAVLESFRETGEQHLSRELLLPYVQRLEDAILKAFTSEELAQMVDESDAEAGKSLRLLAAQLQTEQDIANRKAEQRRAQLRRGRGRGHELRSGPAIFDVLP